MRALTEPDIRASFANCSKGEAQRVALPRDLAGRPWESLDFLGRRDPAAPDRAYLVTEHHGRVVAVTLRIATQHRTFSHRGMCSLCLTECHRPRPLPGPHRRTLSDSQVLSARS